MAPAPTLVATVRFATGASFAQGFQLNSPTFGILGTSTLGTSVAIPVDVTSTVTKVSVQRGRQRVLDRFEVGQAIIELIDTDGRWNPTNPASPFYPNVLPMRQVKLVAQYKGNTYPVFAGYIDSFQYDYQVGVDAARVTIRASDGFKVLRNVSVTAVPGATAGEKTGVRVGKLLDAAGWPTEMRTLSTGITTVQADPGTTRNSLDAIGVVADSELGGFYFGTDGNARFRGRDSVYKSQENTPTSFADDGTGIAYTNIKFGYDDVNIANQVNVTRVGGTTQTVSDATSQAAYFTQSLDRTNLLMDSDADALQQARALLNARKNPVLRIESVEIDLTEDVQARVLAGLTLDFLDRITVKKAHPGGSSITRTLSVQGVSHDITPAVWRTTIRTAENLLDSPFILNSSTFGVLGTSTLAY